MNWRSRVARVLDLIEGSDSLEVLARNANMTAQSMLCADEHLIYRDAIETIEWLQRRRARRWFRLDG